MVHFANEHYDLLIFYQNSPICLIKKVPSHLTVNDVVRVYAEYGSFERHDLTYQVFSINNTLYFSELQMS